MDDQVFRLGVALAIGLLVGLERGWRDRDEPDGSRTAGLRTFGIIGFLGGLFALLALRIEAPVIFGFGFLGVGALYGLFQFHQAQHDDTFSVTGVMAGLTVFVLGGLAVVGEVHVAAAGGATLAVILASRENLHSALRRLTWIELRSALVLAVMTMIILPMLPDRALDPWGGLNPREIWFFTVMIATISFAGYIAVRVLGASRGLLVSALAGAVASSTAVTVAVARMARDAEEPRPLVGAAALAGVVSLLRVLVLIAVLRLEVVAQIALPVLVAAAVLAAAGLVMLLGGTGNGKAAAPPRNPFELRALLVFAALFALVSTASAGLAAHYGGSGLALTAALSGSFDVDLAVLSVLRVSAPGVTISVIGTAILGALAANAFGRVALAALAGPARFWMPLGLWTFAALGAGIIAHEVLPPL